MQKEHRRFVSGRNQIPVLRIVSIDMSHSMTQIIAPKYLRIAAARILCKNVSKTGNVTDVAAGFIRDMSCKLASKQDTFFVFSNPCFYLSVARYMSRMG